MAGVNKVIIEGESRTRPGYANNAGGRDGYDNQRGYIRKMAG